MLCKKPYRTQQIDYTPCRINDFGLKSYGKLEITPVHGQIQIRALPKT